MRFALVGPPGAGKTSVAHALAAELGIESVDLDEVITQRHGPIEEIVYTEGSEKLRELAVETLGEVLSRDGDLVVAVSSAVAGGEDARAALGDAVVVYLAVEMSHSFRRSGLTGPQPPGLVAARALWKRLLDERDPGYRSIATHVVEVGLRDVPGIAREVVRVAAHAPGD